MRYWLAVLLLVIMSAPVLASSTKLSRTKSALMFIAHAAELLVKDIGTVPEQDDWHTLLIQRQEKYSGWNGPYLKYVGLDSWGNSYQFMVREKDLTGVYSFGQNGLDEQGSGDDVTSWGGYDKNIYYPSWRRDIAIKLLITGFIIFFPLFLLFRNTTKRNQ